MLVGAEMLEDDTDRWNTADAFRRRHQPSMARQDFGTELVMIGVVVHLAQKNESARSHAVENFGHDVES